MANSRTTGEMVDGKKHGYWITYYENGIKRSQGRYIHGKKMAFGFNTTKMAARQLKPASLMIS